MKARLTDELQFSFAELMELACKTSEGEMSWNGPKEAVAAKCTLPQAVKLPGGWLSLTSAPAIAIT